MTKREYTNYINSERWRNKRIEAFNNSSKHCNRCDKRLSERTFEAHHIHYDNVGNEKLSDIEILCSKCHFKHHAIGRYSYNKMVNYDKIKRDRQNNYCKEIISCMNALGNKKFSYDVMDNIEITNKLYLKYHINEVKAVLEMKWNDWKNTEIEKYFRPTTVLTKYEKYREEALKRGKIKNYIDQ